MTFLMDTIKGMFIGIANVIPGVNGETIAASLGIYDKLISSISNLLRDWKKSPAALPLIILGCGTGVVGFSYAIRLLLSKYTFVTCMISVDLILGGTPIPVRVLEKNSYKKGSSIRVSGVIALLALFAVVASLPMLSEDTEVLKTFMSTVGAVVSLFLVGIIASAIVVVSGASGSLVMMILGYYYDILEAIHFFIEALRSLDTVDLSDSFLLLLPLDTGVLLDIFLIAKLTTLLFERHGVQTYCVMLGLIVASPFAILYNTGLSEQLSSLKAGSMLVGIVLVIVGMVVTWYPGERLEQGFASRKRS